MVVRVGSSKQPLSKLSVPDREVFLTEVLDEARRWRVRKEQDWLDIYRMQRAVADPDSPYKSKLKHPYAYAAAESLKAVLYPTLFETVPTVQILDANADNKDRNRLLEQLLTAFVNTPVTNFEPAWDDILSNLVWFGFNTPWTYFRDETVLSRSFQPVRGIDGTPLVGQDGVPLTNSVLLPLQGYRAPYLETVDPFDTYLHPDGIRGFVVRDVRGWSLQAQAESENPIYDPVRVRRIFSLFNFSDKGRGINSAPTPGFDNERQRLADEVSQETQRHAAVEASQVTDPRDAIYEIYHYDDGRYSGSYARLSKGGQLLELRFHEGASADGMGNRLYLSTHNAPGEVYGPSITEITKDLLNAQTKFQRAMLDGAALTVNPMWIQSEMMRRRNQELVTGPGAVITAPTGPGDSLDNHIKRMDMPQNWTNAMQLVNSLQSNLDMAWAQDDFSRGQLSSGRKTAFEISNVAQGSRNRIRMLYRRIKSQFAVPLFRKWLAMAVVHYNQSDWERILGPEARNFQPPSLQEVVNGFQYSITDSLFGADKQTRSAQWPTILQMAGQQVQLMQIPHIREMWRRALEDFGIENVVHVMPAAQNIGQTEYQELVSGIAAQGGVPGVGPAAAQGPSSPTDVLRGQGGQQAPPGPANGGGAVSESQNGNAVQRF